MWSHLIRFGYGPPGPPPPVVPPEGICRNTRSNKPELHEVFTISGIPKYTFVKPKEYPRLLMALKTPGRGIIVEGPSGIGKTTAISKAIEELAISANVLKLSARVRADVDMIKQLPEMQPLGTVVIDDFHKLGDVEKRLIADLMNRKPAQEKPWTQKLWIYDLRTNMHFTLKENTLKRTDLD